MEGEEKEKAKDVWIRKVRMGTFEDSGLRKGCVANCVFVFFNVLRRSAFVHFSSIEHATAVLINYHLNGQTLVVEYAGVNAVRHGAPKSAKPVDRPEHKGRSGRKSPLADNPRYRTDRPPKQAEEQLSAVETSATGRGTKAKETLGWKGQFYEGR